MDRIGPISIVNPTNGVVQTVLMVEIVEVPLYGQILVLKMVGGEQVGTILSFFRVTNPRRAKVLWATLQTNVSAIPQIQHHSALAMKMKDTLPCVPKLLMNGN